MNVYKLHSNPEVLTGYDIANVTIPAFAWKKYHDQAEFKQLEHVWALEAKYAYLYAKTILEGPFPAGEDAIAQNPHYAYHYAKQILKGRFPKGEKTISENSAYAYFYAINVIKGRFPKGEKAIAQDTYYLEHYNEFLDKLKNS